MLASSLLVMGLCTCCRRVVGSVRRFYQLFPPVPPSLCRRYDKFKVQTFGRHTREVLYTSDNHTRDGGTAGSPAILPTLFTEPPSPSHPKYFLHLRILLRPSTLHHTAAVGKKVSVITQLVAVAVVEAKLRCPMDICSVSYANIPSKSQTAVLL